MDEFLQAKYGVGPMPTNENNILVHVMYQLEGEEKFNAVKDLIEIHRADIDLQGHGGQTALFSIRDWEDKKLAQYLIDKGANVNAELEDGGTPLTCYFEEEGRDIEYLEMLLKAGANPNHCTHPYLCTPLHYVCHEAEITLLVEYGGDINFINKDGGTPLHSLLAFGNNCHLDGDADFDVMIEEFIRLGADLNTIKDKQGKTCMDRLQVYREEEAKLDAECDEEIEAMFVNKRTIA